MMRRFSRSPSVVFALAVGPRFCSSSSSSISSISSAFFSRRRCEFPNENENENENDDAKRRNDGTRLNYTNVLLVAKETALAKYTSLADSGNQPGYEYRDNVRWDRLKVRHEAHEKAVLKGTRARALSSLDSTRTYYSLAFLPRSLYRKRHHSLSLDDDDDDAHSCVLFYAYLYYETRNAKRETRQCGHF